MGLMILNLELYQASVEVLPCFMETKFLLLTQFTVITSGQHQSNGNIQRRPAFPADS